MKRIWEIVVALFVVGGIVLTLVTATGLVRDWLEDSYDVLVHINDAGGIKKGAPVELGGLRVGKVSGKPYFKKDYTGLLIPLSIQSGIKVPADVIVLVDNPGDGAIVKIPLSEKKEDIRFAEADDTLNGFRIDRDQLRQKSMDDTMDRFEKSMQSLDSTSAAMSRMLTLLEGRSSPDDTSGGSGLPGIPLSGLPGMPSQDALASVNRTMDSFEKTNQKLSKSIDNFDRFLLSAEEGLGRMDSSINGFDKSMLEITEMADNGDRTFIKIHDMADENTDTLADFHLAVNEFRGFIDQAEPLLVAVQEGDGLMKTLVNDPCFDQDVRQLVDKIEKHGMLFYPRTRLRATPVRKIAATDPQIRKR